jgi:hypothetical protein
VWLRRCGSVSSRHRKSPYTRAYSVRSTVIPAGLNSMGTRIMILILPGQRPLCNDVLQSHRYGNTISSSGQLIKSVGIFCGAGHDQSRSIAMADANRILTADSCGEENLRPVQFSITASPQMSISLPPSNCPVHALASSTTTTVMHAVPVL